MDLDRDGVPEVVAGSSAYRADGTLLWNAASVPDGVAAAADVDGDGYPEIVLVANELWLLEHDGTVAWGPVDVPGAGYPGPATVADFDGDGRPEIGVGDRLTYSVFEAYGSLAWTTATAQIDPDYSTGGAASAFDLDGDGAAELVLADPAGLHVLRRPRRLRRRRDPDRHLHVQPRLPAGRRRGRRRQGRDPARLERDLHGEHGPRPAVLRRGRGRLGARAAAVEPVRVPAADASFLAEERHDPAGSRYASADLTASYVRRTEEGTDLRFTVRVGNAGAGLVGAGDPGGPLQRGPPRRLPVPGRDRHHRPDRARRVRGREPRPAQRDLGAGPGRRHRGRPGHARVLGERVRRGEQPRRLRLLAEPPAGGLRGPRPDREPARGHGRPGGHGERRRPAARGGPRGHVVLRHGADRPPQRAPLFADPHALTTTATLPVAGEYLLALEVSDSIFEAIDFVTVTVHPANVAPVVSAGPDRVVELPEKSVLAGRVGVGRRPAPRERDAGGVDGRERAGAGRLRRSGFGRHHGHAVGGRHVRAAPHRDRRAALRERRRDGGALTENEAPVVSAGPDVRAFSLVAPLAGSVSDDGKPRGGTLTSAWSLVSGPGLAAFADPASPSTTVTFGAAGTYVLRLSASDGTLTATDDVVVTANPANEPPVVDAGPPQAVTSRQTVLHGTVRDDGLPAGSSVTVLWSQVSGPAPAALATPASADTAVAFDAEGPYVFRLAASDGEASAEDTVAVTVGFVNAAPVVEAGPDATLALPADAVLLQGSVADDGLPLGAAVTRAWAVVSGPAPVVFDAPQAEETTARFTRSGDVRAAAAGDGRRALGRGPGDGGGPGDGADGRRARGRDHEPRVGGPAEPAGGRGGHGHERQPRELAARAAAAGRGRVVRASPPARSR